MSVTAPEFIDWMSNYIFWNSDASHTASRHLAATTLQDFLIDERIKFGDPAYSWDKTAAMALVEECILVYAEKL